MSTNLHLGPVFRALVHGRGRFWLVTLEIAFALAVIANCLNLVEDVRRRIARPTGLDEAHLVAVEALPFAAPFQEDSHVDAVRREDLQRLRHLPGVRAAAAVDYFPLGGDGRFTFRRPEGSDLDPVGAPYFFVGRDVVDTLGVRIVAGRDFDESDFAVEEEARAATQEAMAKGEPPPPEPVSSVLVTQALADLLFPDGDALNRVIESEEGTKHERIVGILERMHNAWPETQYVEYAMLYPRRPASNRWMRYLVRLAPGEGFRAAGIGRAVEDSLLAVDDGRTVSVRPLSEVKAATYGDSRTLARLLGLLVVLLLVVTSLGVVGLTAYAVTQRYRQIGTRRALGARRLDVVGHFLVENAILTAAGLAAGVPLAFAVQYGLGRVTEGPTLGWGVVLVAAALLAAVSAGAAVLPASRGAVVPPVVATRTV